MIYPRQCQISRLLNFGIADSDDTAGSLLVVFEHWPMSLHSPPCDARSELDRPSLRLLLALSLSPGPLSTGETLLLERGGATRNAEPALFYSIGSYGSGLSEFQRSWNLKQEPRLCVTLCVPSARKFRAHEDAPGGGGRTGPLRCTSMPLALAGRRRRPWPADGPGCLRLGQPEWQPETEVPSR
jgi:hypothetical protein